MNDKMKRVVIAGGTGFIGSALVKEFLARDYHVIVLSRKPTFPRIDCVTEVEWNTKYLGDWIKHLEGAEAVINLAGKNISCRHTPENIRELAESRIDAVRTISVACSHVAVPPKVWIQASATGFYGNRGSETCDEKSLPGHDRLADICKQWEGVFNTATVPKTRKVLFRIGFVLGRKGGALPVLASLTRLFLGGRAGNGRQYISWIHLGDLTKLFLAAIDDPSFSGTYNAVAPNPVMNREFMRDLRRTLIRPWCPPVPAWAVRFGALAMDTDPSLALDGCRVLPKRLVEARFPFQFSELRPALKNLYQ